ncbi:MAG TPA: GNAT family N-acetyltransferase [Candidatus Dormibacteraeota bacterium]|jgi:GNAT superfamily N-acetyltransferase|nr:GNAT family N-acetyltransferase [Candidatus Dormibacteraeota bacterium]
MRWDFRIEEDERPDGGGREGYVDRTGPWIRDGLGSGRWRAWLVEAGEEAAGQVFLQVVERFPPIEGGEAGPLGYLTSFYVRPAWRGRGAGAARRGRRLGPAARGRGDRGLALRAQRTAVRASRIPALRTAARAPLRPLLTAHLRPVRVASAAVSDSGLSRSSERAAT